MVDDEGDRRKPFEHGFQLRDEFRFHVGHDGDAVLLGAGVAGKDVGIVDGEDGPLQRRATREDPDARQAAGEPCLHLPDSVRLEHVHGEDPGERLRIPCDRIRQITAVGAVCGGGMDDGSPVDPGLSHAFDQRSSGHRALMRPVRSFPAHGRDRIALRVMRNDVGMDVDNGHCAVPRSRFPTQLPDVCPIA